MNDRFDSFLAYTALICATIFVLALWWPAPLRFVAELFMGKP